VPEEVLDDCGGATIGAATLGGCGVATTREAEMRSSKDIYSCSDLQEEETLSQVGRGITCSHTSR